MQRYGNHNAKNTELWEETQRLGGNKYREIYLKQRMKHKCYEGCWEEHCGRCGQWGHYKGFWCWLKEIWWTVTH